MVKIISPDINDGDAVLEKSFDVEFSVLLLAILGLVVALAVSFIPHPNLLTL
jgi:hypothetical protein